MWRGRRRAGGAGRIGASLRSSGVVGHEFAPVRDLASVPPSATAVPEPARAPLPEKLLLRAKRPFAGLAMRFYGPFALIGMAMIFLPRGPVFWAFLGAAVLWFALFPAVVQALLGPIERKVLAATPKTAPGLLDSLRSSSRV